MTDDSAGDDGPGAVLADPRVDRDHLRAAVGPEGDPLLLVGAVHDHPASVFRVRTLVETLAPDVVAVELPGLAVGLFEAVGRHRDADGPAVGEMSAALAAGADVDADRVGIDTLDVRFGRHLASELREASPSLGTLRRVLGGISTVGSHAVSCRVAAALGRTETATSARKGAYDYAVDATASPTEQATDEREQLSRSLSVLRAFERPVADAVVDRARERTMAENLLERHRDGTVLAVVGFDHLADVADALGTECPSVATPDAELLRDHWGGR